MFYATRKYEYNKRKNDNTPKSYVIQGLNEYLKDLTDIPQEVLDIMPSGVYFGNLTQVQGWLWIMVYDSLEKVRAAILTSQDTSMELKELDLVQN